jgi:hypothetical protein
MNRLIALAALLVATPAFAAPKYLTCTETKAGGGWKLSIAVSEDQQVVTYKFEEGLAIVKSDALFSAGNIQWRNYQSAGIGMTFMLNRVSLAMGIIEHVGQNVKTTYGTCIVDPIPKQAV